jgi:hypothetical protein
MVVGVIVAAVWPGAVPGLLASATLVGAGAGALAVPRTELMQVLVPHAPSRRETGARLGGPVPCGLHGGAAARSPAA